MLAASTVSRLRGGAAAALRNKAALMATARVPTASALSNVRGSAPAAAFASHSKRALSSQGANLQKARHVLLHPIPCAHQPSLLTNLNLQQIPPPTQTGLPELGQEEPQRLGALRLGQRIGAR